MRIYDAPLENLVKTDSGYARLMDTPCDDKGSEQSPIEFNAVKCYRKNGSWYVKPAGYTVFHRLRLQLVSQKYDELIARETWLLRG